MNLRLLPWAGIALLTLTFSEVGGRQLWRGGGTLAASASALLALPLVLVPGRLRALVAGVPRPLPAIASRSSSESSSLMRPPTMTKPK